jgi:transcriptional regulator with XRE-family HTH domain
MYPNIEAERVRKGLSQDEVIEKLGYKERKTYYNWLSSGNIPTSVLIKMAELFNCSIDYLLGRSA